MLPISHYLPNRLGSRDALSTGDADGVVKVLWFLTLEVVMQQFCSLTCGILTASQFGYWVQSPVTGFCCLIALQLSCEYGLIQSARDKKGYSRPVNHSALLYSVVYNFLCTSVALCAYRLITAEMFPSFLCVRIRIG